MSQSHSAPTQIQINFDAGLLDRFPRFEECLRACVHKSKHQLKYIAADLDDTTEQTITSSKLSRMLAPYSKDGPQFPARLLPELIEAMDDLTPVYWLIERFLEDAGERRKRALDQIADMLPHLHALVEQAAPGEKTK